MHFEILVEDRSGEAALKILLPKIISNEHTYKIHHYSGIGHIPKNITSKTEVGKMLLNQLPRLLNGYGRTYTQSNYNAVVIVVCDLDNKDKASFLSELNNILESCTHKPNTRFCLAIEEGEAWLLGDINAIKTAYPNAKMSVLSKYVNDSICGTWELLADAIYKGGSDVLMAKGYPEIGAEKFKWAENICPHMDVNSNSSPSFNDFKNSVKELI